jgi:hypothetical protein
MFGRPATDRLAPDQLCGDRFNSPPLVDVQKMMLGFAQQSLF